MLVRASGVDRVDGNTDSTGNCNAVVFIPSWLDGDAYIWQARGYRVYSPSSAAHDPGGSAVLVTIVCDTLTSRSLNPSPPRRPLRASPTCPVRSRGNSPLTFTAPLFFRSFRPLRPFRRSSLLSFYSCCASLPAKPADRARSLITVQDGSQSSGVWNRCGPGCGGPEKAAGSRSTSRCFRAPRGGR